MGIAPRLDLILETRLRRLRVNARALETFLARACGELGLGPHIMMSLALVGPVRIRALKNQHFGLDQTTDCIAFSVDGGPVESGPRFLGEVFLCPDEIARNARGLARAFDEEFLFVAAHGLLHLLGWEDDTPRRQRRMFARQTELVTACRPRTRVASWIGR